MLFVIDGSKALRKAIRNVFGERVPVQRCHPALSRPPGYPDLGRARPANSAFGGLKVGIIRSR